MNKIAVGEADPPREELWRQVPLECFVCAFAVILAGLLKLCGAMP